jgi:hypothetical protein
MVGIALVAVWHIENVTKVTARKVFPAQLLMSNKISIVRTPALTVPLDLGQKCF